MYRIMALIPHILFEDHYRNFFCEDRRCSLGDVYIFILGIQLGRSDVIITSKEES